MDCFHHGHKNLLEQMRRTGRKVIVVLHDDYSCYQIKNKFPVQKFEHRKANALLTGLVDEVIETTSIESFLM
jgi:cytidyltransferase-like protein